MMKRLFDRTEAEKCFSKNQNVLQSMLQTHIKQFFQLQIFIDQALLLGKFQTLTAAGQKPRLKTAPGHGTSTDAHYQPTATDCLGGQSLHLVDETLVAGGWCVVARLATRHRPAPQPPIVTGQPPATTEKTYVLVGGGGGRGRKPAKSKLKHQ